MSLKLPCVELLSGHSIIKIMLKFLVIEKKWTILVKTVLHRAGKITCHYFLGKYFSKGAIDMESSPNAGNNPSNKWIKKKKSPEIKLCLIMWNDMGKKYWTHEESEVQKGIKDISWNISVIKKQSSPLLVQINISWFSPNCWWKRCHYNGVK